MSIRKKLGIIAFVLVGALLVFGTTMLPVLVKNRVCEAVQKATGRVTSIESVSINPFTITVRANGLVIQEADGGTFITCSALRAAVRPSSIYKRSLILSEVTLESPTAMITRTSPGRYNFSDIIELSQAHRQPVSESPFPVSIAEISINNGTVLFSDAVPKVGFKGSLNNIDIRIKHFSTAADTPAEYELSLLADNEASLASKGSFSLSPLAGHASSELKGLNLQKGWPYLARFLTAPVKGILDLSGAISFSKAAGLNVKDGCMTIQNLSTRYGANEGAEVSSVSVTGASFRQLENRLEIAGVKLSKGNILCSREVTGKLSPLSLLAAHKSSTPETSRRRNVAPRFSYRLKQLQVEHLNLQFCDKTRPTKPVFRLRDADMVLANLNGPDATPARLAFSATLGKQATLKASGDITPYPFTYKGDISAHHLPIKDFEEYFPRNLKVRVVNGYLNSAMKVDIALKESRPVGTFRGSSGVHSFRSIDTAAGEDVLRWESLQLDDLSGNLEPFLLDVRAIALNGVYSRIIVRKDGTLNLQHLTQQTEEPATLKKPGPLPATTIAAVAAPPKSNRSKHHVTIGAITIQDGTLSFSDTHLPQLFSTTFHKLGGRVSGLSSEESTFADIDLRGSLESQSPLQITGKINPLRNDLYLDLKISFHDIELSPASPYSGSYLGYAIEKGKLYLDLKYHIEKKLLTSENRIFIDQFTFGSKIESDKATSLPVMLALAMLKDSRGEIHLNVPVSGRIDNPELSIWKLIGQAFANLLKKAVTSPLELLSSMSGSNDDFSAIQFENGTNHILGDDQLKLDKLAKVLLDRPTLKLKLTGYVDHEKDVEGYRLELFNRKLAFEKIASLRREERLKAGEDIDTIQILPEEFAGLLDAVYRKEKFPKPRTVLGRVKDLPPAEMKKLIIVNIIIGNVELRRLADERVATIMNYLVRKGSIPAERLFRNDDDISKAPEINSISRSRVEIAAIVQ